MGDFDGLKLEDIIVEGENLAEKYPDELPETETGSPEAVETPADSALDLDQGVETVVDEPIDESRVADQVIDTPVDGQGVTDPPVDESTPPSTDPVLDVDAVINERFEGKYKTLDDLNEVVSQLDEIMGDEFMKNAVEYYKANKTLAPYLRAMSYDFDKMSDEEVLRLNYNDKNQDLSPKLREKMFQKEVLSKFMVSEDADSEEVEIAQALLKREANTQRSALLDEQKKYVEPQPQATEPEKESAATPQAPDPKVIEQQTLEVEGTINGLMKEGNLSISIGENESFNMAGVDVRAMAENAIDMNKMGQHFLDGKGAVNWQKWSEAMSFIMNPDQFKKDLLNYGKSLGKEAIEADLKNPVDGSAGVDIAGGGDDRIAMLHSFADQVQSKR